MGPMRHAPLALSLSIALALPLAACRDDQDPAGAAALWARVQQSDYRSFARARTYPGREPSFTLHASSVEIFLNPTLAGAAEGPVPLREWPVGSLVVKEGYSGDTLSLVAVMEKRDDGWFFAEYGADGEALYSGRPAICTGCHDARKDYSDWLFSLEMPR